MKEYNEPTYIDSVLWTQQKVNQKDAWKVQTSSKSDKEAKYKHLKQLFTQNFFWGIKASSQE